MELRNEKFNVIIDWLIFENFGVYFYNLNKYFIECFFKLDIEDVFIGG